MKLETKRLELRSPEASDASHLQALFSDPEIRRYLPPFPPMTPERAKARVEARMKMEAELGYTNLVIFQKEAGRFIGSGGLSPISDDIPDVEIAYHILPSEWGKGYATEAASAILEWGFKKLKLKEILGFTFPNNAASWRVVEKVGMRYVGLARYPDVEVDVKKYVADQETWTLPTSSK